jgi:hypothetical protein
MTQRFDDSVFAPQIREIIREKVDVQEAILSQGIGQLEAMVSEDTDEHRLVPEWAGFIAEMLNQYHMAPNIAIGAVMSTSSTT